MKFESILVILSKYILTHLEENSSLKLSDILKEEIKELNLKSSDDLLKEFEAKYSKCSYGKYQGKSQKSE